MKKNKLLLFLFIFRISSTFAESASSITKEADLLKEQQKYVEAIAKYTSALLLKPAYRDALEGRTYCYLKTKDYIKAIEDYKFLINIKPHNVSYIVGLGDAYLSSGKQKTSIEYYQRALSEENDNMDCFEKIIIAYIRCKDYDAAQRYCNDAMSKSIESARFFFLKGIALDSAKNHQTATMSYERAISMLNADEKYLKLLDKKAYKEYFSNLARNYQLLFRYPDAEKYYLEALRIDKIDVENMIELGKVYYLENKYTKAIEQFEEALKLNADNSNIYFNKGLAYKKLNQFFNAIQDFNSAIRINSKLEKAYFEKAMCFEELNQFTNAINTYDSLKLELPDNVEVIKFRRNCITKQYDASRESNKPIINIISPSLSETEGLIIPVSRSVVEFKGKIIDESRILKVLIGDDEVKIDTDKINPFFTANVSVENKTSITIKAIDIYNNTQTSVYNLSRKENEPPNIELIEPLATFNNEIYIGKNNTTILKIEGSVIDESLIKSLIINGIVTSISLLENNPTFTVELDISKTDSIIFEATDFFGNKSTTKFTINRKAAAESAINPMGITWVIFISNSNYLNFTSLDGPEKDKLKLKAALANYRVEKFIEKLDMTKEEMEKFFAIELRNLLKSRRVNSLVIWYAGHGKYLNDNGYWIPVNANKGEEYSYFQITNLKGYISTYKLLNHVLVVSDACETGPAFCNTTGAGTDPGSCETSDAINLVSSQVFTSSNTEQSSDISVFAESFCKILETNSAKCISIEKIKNEVTNAVTSSQKQKPSFGKISGLEHKGGSFYFMKR